MATVSPSVYGERAEALWKAESLSSSKPFTTEAMKRLALYVCEKTDVPLVSVEEFTIIKQRTVNNYYTKERFFLLLVR